MMKWLATLPLHHYGPVDGRLEDASPLYHARKLCESQDTKATADQNDVSVCVPYFYSKFAFARIASFPVVDARLALC